MLTSALSLLMIQNHNLEGRLEVQNLTYLWRRIQIVKKKSLVPFSMMISCEDDGRMCSQGGGVQGGGDGVGVGVLAVEAHSDIVGCLQTLSVVIL